MDDQGIEVEIGPEALARLQQGRAGRLASGVRLIFRATLSAERDAGGGWGVGVETPETGRIGHLGEASVLRYGPVLNELRRVGRVGVCAGYLQRDEEGRLEARLLLHEPYECFRRIETDVLDTHARARPGQADGS